ncbi:4-alpha-glucanotransferase [Oerskovia sp. NPDC057915]|uniref:4-alpha-glucanotransferase n=1 Tax=Oerskovia sp. NPDC057915 TaxID=3346280 RepID=UPI0036D9BB2A
MSVPQHVTADVPEPLVQLAAAHGVAPDFWGFDGTQRQVSAQTLVAVLEALGVPASSPEKVAVSLEHSVDDEWRQMLPPTVVVRQGDEVRFPVHVADGAPVEVWAELEPVEQPGFRSTAPAVRERRALTQVDAYVEPRTVDGRAIGRATFAVPADLPLGWHEIHAASEGTQARATLVVTPQRLELPEAVREARAWGLMTQLYSVRSKASWGVGDLADLADLAWLGAHRAGADFVLVNPLAAAEPRTPMTPSPYLPTSRRFVNPLYIRVEDVRETGYLSAADRSLVEWAFDPIRDLSSDSGPIDRDAAWEAKKAALEVVFAAPRSTARQAAFDAFRAEQGKGLEDFATWCTLADHFGDRDWPPQALDPSSPAVAALRDQLDDQVEFYCWLQWVADEQLEVAQRTALGAGMSIGIMHDLAVGVHPHGADAWAHHDVLAGGVTVGAPPDMYNQQGQNWSQPPWDPRALARAGYAPFRDLLRTVLRHAGAVRVDHVIGLFRLWWIPGAARADAGAYVRYDHEALVGILCLEAHRAGAMVIGEDLGVYEPWVRDYLAERGILGTSVLWFEKGEGGRPLAPEAYRRLALATVTTHDLPPTAGYLAGEHVDLRERLGLLTEPAAQVRQAARAERDGMVAFLAERGLIGDDPSERELVEALHVLIAQTPAALIGVSLADAVGERRTQNQPGTDQEYPNWKVPLGDSSGNVVLLEDLFDNARLLSLAKVMRESLSSPPR